MEAATIPVPAQSKQQQQNPEPVAPLLRAAGLLRDPVPVYFSFLLAVALIYLQALNAFPAAQMG